MKIALIYPPYTHKAFNENLNTVDQEFGRFPYLDFAWVARCLKIYGADVKLFDAAARSLPYPLAKKEIEDYSPDLLVFPAHSSQTIRDIFSWANLLKKDLDLPQLFGGYEAHYYPQEIMAQNCVDFLCTGEIYPFLPEFLDAFFHHKNFDSVSDLYYKKNNRVVRTKRGEKIPFDQLGIPDRSIFDNTLYYSHVSQRKNFTIGISSRGCPYPCSFCDGANTQHEERNLSLVLHEIEECIDKHDIHEIDWFDPIMFLNKNRIHDLSSAIKEKKLDFIWSARTRIDTLLSQGNVDELFIRKIAESGCKRLFLGIESSNKEIQDAIQKPINPTSTKKVLSCLQEHGIRPLGFFMIGNPNETIETVKDTIRYAKKLPLDYAQFSMTIMKPHANLTAQYFKQENRKDFWREYVLGNENEKILPTPWTNLSRKDQERLTRMAYLSFYLRPKILLKTLRDTKNKTEFFRYFTVGFKMIFQWIRSK